MPRSPKKARYAGKLQESISFLTSPSPAKKPVSKKELSSDLLSSFIEHPALTTSRPLDQPATPNTSPMKRKKAVVISDDDSSEIEVVKGPTSSPKKARAATPPPGSDEFHNLPPVSFAKSVAGKVSENTNVAFGSTRPVRTRSKTEKGTYYAEHTASKTSRNKSSSVRSNTFKGDSTNDTSLLDSPFTLNVNALPSIKHGDAGGAFYGDTEAVSLRPAASKCSKTKITVKQEPVSEDDLPEVSQLLLSSPVKRKAAFANPTSPKKSSPLLSLFKLEAKDEQRNASDHSASNSDDYLATDDDGSIGYQSDQAPACKKSDDISVDSASDKEMSDEDDDAPDGISDNPDDVTSTAHFEPSMRKIYQGLPYLDELRPIDPYGKALTKSARISISKTIETLKKTYADSLMAGILFTQSNYFVNFSRINPNILRNDKSRIRMARADNAAAVGMYTGVCMRGTILDVDLSGPPQNPYDVHGITVAGSNQDTRRYMAVIGAVLGYHRIVGPMTEKGLSFYTRGEGKDGNFPSSVGRNVNFPSSIVIPDDIGGSSALPFITSVPISVPDSGMRTFPMSRSFDDRIPVYDGREGHGRKFNFTDDDFKDLASWPLYRRGNGEVEVGTIVSVGHTVSTYQGGGGGLFLSTNIHFVMVLGKPTLSL